MVQKTCIVGTDTGIGKTYACCQIMQHLSKYDHKVSAIKPISSGGLIQSKLGLINEDVYHLLNSSNHKLNLSQVTQFTFKQPIAPHIAAYNENTTLTVQNIIDKVNLALNELSFLNSILIEGVGGVMVPLNRHETYIDLLKQWDFPVIMVVGMKLGCLNHALLTYMALINNNIDVVGWIANQIDSQMDAYSENMESLINKLPIPLLAVIPNNGNLQPQNEFNKVFVL